MKEISNEAWLAEINKYKQSTSLMTMTQEEKDFLLVAREKGLSFSDVATAINNLFGKSYKKDYINDNYKRLIGKL
jgi:hypothetical protein